MSQHRGAASLGAFVSLYYKVVISCFFRALFPSSAEEGRLRRRRSRGWLVNVAKHPYRFTRSGPYESARYAEIDKDAS